MKKVVAAWERQSGHLTVVRDDGSVFTHGGDMWRESAPPIPGAAAERKMSRAVNILVNVIAAYVTEPSDTGRRQAVLDALHAARLFGVGTDLALRQLLNAAEVAENDEHGLRAVEDARRRLGET